MKALLVCIILIASFVILCDGKKCATDRVREYKQIPKRTEEQHNFEKEMADNMAKKRQSDVIYVPVNYHVLQHSDGRGRVENSTLFWQTSVLNTAFGQWGYSFYTRKINRVTSNIYTLNCEDYLEEITDKYTESPHRVLNVYLCVQVSAGADGEGSVLGFTFVAGDLPPNDKVNSVFILYETLPGGSLTRYNQGDTLVHETGHFFGLLHTFEGGCSTRNDRVDDTPACLDNSDIDCPNTRDTCPSFPGYDDVRNYMDYSVDSCLDHFTPGQGARLSAQTALYKPDFALNTNSSDPSVGFPDFQEPNQVVPLSPWLTNLKSAIHN